MAAIRVEFPGGLTSKNAFHRFLEASTTLKVDSTRQQSRPQVHPRTRTPGPGSWFRCTAPSHATIGAVCEVVVHALVADPIVGFELHRVAIAPTTPLVAGEVVVATVLLRVPTGHEAIDREHPAGRLRCQACTEGCTPLAFALSQHIQSPGFQWRRSFLRVLQKTHICFQRGLHWEHVLQTQALSSIRLFCLSSSSSSSSDLPDSRLSTSTLVSCLFGSHSSQTSYFAGVVPLVGHRFCQGGSGLNLSCRHKSGRGGWETGRERAREVSSPAFKADVPSEHHACGTKHRK